MSNTSGATTNATLNLSANQPIREYLRVELLDFDPENPRFPSEINAGPTSILMESFIRDERLQEIIISIADQGYFEGEELLVVRNGNRFNVIEGNRRLAALKLLSGELSVPDGRISIEEICSNALHRPKTAPCLTFDSPDRILRYLGFRHITGIKSWGALQKARYLKRMSTQFYSDKIGKIQHQAMAREIGSRADYVGQILTALSIYEKAESAEFYNVIGLNPQEIDFSVLSTAISYTNIADYIGLESRQDTIGAHLNEEHLRNILSWMFVARGNQKSILGDSRNLKKLAAIVESEDAIKELIKNGDLEASYQLSRGPALALNLALKSVANKLQDAWSWLPLIDSPDPGDEDIADVIRRKASEIRDAIKSKRQTDDD